MRQIAITTAGTTPPMNSPAMEICVIDPRSNMAMLGGTVDPMTAEEASTAAPSSFEYCSLSGMLRMTVRRPRRQRRRSRRGRTPGTC